MRFSTSQRGLFTGVLFFALTGCQLINGSYTLESSGAGSSCVALAICCTSLAGTEQSTCVTLTTLGDTQACTSFLQSTCSAIPLPDAGTPRDAAVGRGDGAIASDGSTRIDSSGSIDAGQSGSDPLDGTWDLSEVDCNGQSLGLAGTTTMTFAGMTVQQATTLSDGCVITDTLTQATVTSSDISAPGGTSSCGSACTTNDACSPSTLAAAAESYTLSGTSLTIVAPTDTGTCSSGTLTYLWSRAS